MPRKRRYRVYNESHIEILSLIKEAKSPGATLAQLKDALVYTDGEVDWVRVGQFLTEMKSQLTQQIDELNNKINKIDQCLVSIESCPKGIDSPPRGRH
nr:MerR family transcriptional regulator [Marinifaba aquimaris]